MEKLILWGSEIEKSFPKVSECQLDDFLELLWHIEKNGIRDVISEKTLEEEDLWNWLYSKNQIELNDIKRELRRRIEKTGRIDDKEFLAAMDRVGKSDRVKRLVLFFDRKHRYHISTIGEYYDGIRCYLTMEKKDEFCKDLPDCFPNIYFCEGIEASVNTLNKKFEDCREEIIEHLTEINDYQIRFGELLEEHRSYQDISREFTLHTGIACSPQAGREKVQALKETCLNKKSGQEEVVICELHTKFKKFNIDTTRQDRIYFSPGKPGIREGKILVKHIGAHL